MANWEIRNGFLTDGTKFLQVGEGVSIVRGWDKDNIKLVGVQNGDENYIDIYIGGGATIDGQTPADLTDAMGKFAELLGDSNDVPQTVFEQSEDDILNLNPIEALQNGDIVQRGNPTIWNAHTYVVNRWRGEHILQFGRGNENDANGLTLLNIPLNLNTLWLRCLGDRWLHVNVKDSSGKDFGDWIGGYNYGLTMNPQGGVKRGHWSYHLWFPINIKGHNGTIYLTSKAGTTNDAWFSGYAVTKNPLGLSRMCVRGLSQSINGSTNVTYNRIWNNSPLGHIAINTVATIKVPFVDTGCDKVFFIDSSGQNHSTNCYSAIRVEGVELEDRLSDAAAHPYATHLNSNLYHQYFGVRVPKELLPTDGRRFIDVQIDTTNSNTNFQIREIGTHDFPKWLK